MDEVADLVAICNTEEKLVFLNAAARALAVTSAAGDGLDPGVWGDWYDADDRPVAPEDWPLRRALRGERVEVEGYRINPDGSRFWMLLSGAPIRDEAGKILGAIATSKVITERKRIEAETRAQNEELARRVGARTEAFEALQRALAQEVREHLDAAYLLERSRRLLQAILDRTPAVIYVKDTSFRYLLVNAQFERIFHVDNAETAGRTDYDLFPSEIVAPLRANDEQVLASGESLQCEEVVPQEDGLHAYVSLKFPLRDDDGTIFGVCGISTDITKLRQAEQQASRHQAELAHLMRLHTVGEMAATLAHEINQPLGAIANYALGGRRRLDAGTMTPQDLRHAMAEIAREALRAGEITRWVRDLIRKEEPRREISDIGAIIGAALAIVAPSAKDRGLQVRFRQHGPLPPVDVDRIQIEQVVLNLVLNALDAVEGETQRREVEVRAAAQGDAVEVSVSDSGPALAPEVFERFFEPFFTTKTTGLGMGLAISRAIIEAHDGVLSVARNPDGGSIFTFALPAAPARPT